MLTQFDYHAPFFPSFHDKYSYGDVDSHGDMKNYERLEKFTRLHELPRLKILSDVGSDMIRREGKRGHRIIAAI